MRKMTQRSGKPLFVPRRMAWVCIVCAGLVSVQTSRAHAEPSRDGSETLWAENDEFVKLVPQDTLTTGPTPPNQHPVAVNPDELAAALAKVTFHKIDRPIVSFGRDEQAFPLVDRRAAAQLAPHLARALQQASPRQDVAFAVLMWAKAAVLGSSDVTVAARAFYSGDKLNLIVGDLYRSAVSPDYRKAPVASRQIDRRLYPHEPGSRAHETPHDDARFDMVPGIQQVALDGHLRQDWLILDLAALSAPTAQTQGAPASAVGAQQNATKAEERLELLKRLHDRGLLTDEEFAHKRKEVIDQL
jgi:hypothetical protein